jgi:hypothetical protein
MDCDTGAELYMCVYACVYCILACERAVSAKRVPWRVADNVRHCRPRCDACALPCVRKRECRNCASGRLVTASPSRYVCMCYVCKACVVVAGVVVACRHVRSSTTYTLLLAHFVHSTYVCFRLLRVSTYLYRYSGLTHLYHDIYMQAKSTKAAGTTARATARAFASTATASCTRYVFRPQMCCAFCGCCGHIGGDSVGNSRSIIVKSALLALRTLNMFFAVPLWQCCSVWTDCVYGDLCVLLR